MKQFVLRLLKTVFGLFLYALGIYFTVQANIGLAPWDAFSQGVSNMTGIAFGTVISLTGLVILLLVWLLKEKIGIGTLLNTLLIGVFVNFLNWLNLLPKNNSLFTGILLLLLGQVIICFGSYFYIGTGLGCGPRDSLMVALCKRMKKVPVGVIRGGLEATVLLAGWLMGAKVGLGTVIAIVGIGLILQAVFHIMKFDVKAVQHESLFDSWKLLKELFMNHGKQQLEQQPLEENSAK